MVKEKAATLFGLLLYQIVNILGFVRCQSAKFVGCLFRYANQQLNAAVVGGSPATRANTTAIHLTHASTSPLIHLPFIRRT